MNLAVLNENVPRSAPFDSYHLIYYFRFSAALNVFLSLCESWTWSVLAVERGSYHSPSSKMAPIKWTTALEIAHILERAQGIMSHSISSFFNPKANNNAWDGNQPLASSFKKTIVLGKFQKDKWSSKGTSSLLRFVSWVPRDWFLKVEQASQSELVFPRRVTVWYHLSSLDTVKRDRECFWPILSPGMRSIQSVPPHLDSVLVMRRDHFKQIDWLSNEFVA